MIRYDYTVWYYYGENGENDSDADDGNENYENIQQNKMHNLI